MRKLTVSPLHGAHGFDIIDLQFKNENLNGGIMTNDGIVYVDQEDGVKRVMNNRMLYVRLLTKFKAETNLNELRAALDAADYERAQAAAHTLKGVAANLSLAELYKQALNVETQIKAGAVAADALDTLDDCFEETLSAVDRVIAQYGS